MNSSNNYSNTLLNLVKIWVLGLSFPTFMTLYWFVLINDVGFLLWSVFNDIPLLSFLAFKFHKSTLNKNNEKTKNDVYELARFLYILYFTIVFVIIILSGVSMSKYGSSILEYLNSSYLWLGLLQVILFVVTAKLKDSNTEQGNSNQPGISLKNDVALDGLKSELRENIANNEFDFFFKRLDQHKPVGEKIIDKITHLKSQYTKLNDELSRGVIDRSSANQEWNKIRTNSLEIISNL